MPAGGVEVGLRRRLAPVRDTAVWNDVEVGRQDLRLRPVGGDLVGENGLLHLAPEGLGVVEEQQLGKLLLDGRAALHDVARRYVRPQRPQRSLVVDAAVLVEAAILDRDGRLLQPRRYAVTRYGDPVLGRGNTGEQPAVIVTDHAVDPREVLRHGGDADA